MRINSLYIHRKYNFGEKCGMKSNDSFVALFHLLHSNHDYYYKFRISYHVTACNILCDLI